jgi:hypothetical protein
VVDRPQVEIDSLEAAESALDRARLLSAPTTFSAAKALSSTLVRMT